MNINLEKLRGKEIKIVGHKNADFDSMTSGIILKYIFDQLDITSQYVLQDGKSDNRFMETTQKLNIDIKGLGIGITNNDDIFLVDHTGRYPYNNVLGCIDHHPPVTEMKDNYVYKQQTSCAKIINDYAEELGIELPDELITLVVYSCYLDSLSFTSTKAVSSDLDWCKEKIQKLGLNENEIIEFGYGFTDLSDSPEVFAFNGAKAYPFGDKQTIKASYTILKDINDIDLNQIDNILRNEISRKNIAWCFLAHDITNKMTVALLIQEDGTDIVCANGLLSRGQMVIPNVLDSLSNCSEFHLKDEYINEFVPLGSSLYDAIPDPSLDIFLDNIPDNIIDGSKFPISGFFKDINETDLSEL